MLTSKTSCFLLVSLAFLLGALLVLPSQGQTWPAFQRKHIDSTTAHLPVDLDMYCENMMRTRQLTYPLCKSVNAFIHELDYIVQQVCQNIKGPASRTSPNSFTEVLCVQTGGFPPYSCTYEGYVLTGRIRVTCKEYVPIHYIGIV
ncbi:hypothetical protein Chor_009535 [Crotalus horridus]